MTLPNYHRGVVVAFTPAAWESCFRRFGRWDLVITWEQAQAWAQGVAEAPEPERAGRMAEALTYFEARQFTGA